MTKPPSEIFEDMKELRRQGAWPNVPAAGGSGESREVADLLRAARQVADVPPGELVRTLDVMALAERVFGDRAKAGAWLERPNHAMTGQKPFDLLRDELGAAVVRETLEQIDNGIFA